MPRTAPNLGGGAATNLDATAFEARFNMPLVHEAVRAELNARRRGTVVVVVGAGEAGRGEERVAGSRNAAMADGRRAGR